MTMIMIDVQRDYDDHESDDDNDDGDASDQNLFLQPASSNDWQSRVDAAKI